MQIGDKVKIKQEAWIRFLNEESYYGKNRPNPGVRTVITMPGKPPFQNSVMLDFPYYWWKEEDLEIISP